MEASETRKKLWVTLSRLWLDNEMSKEGITYIVNEIKASGYSKQEVEHIFMYELTPFLYANLLSVAGEWAGFDPDWICTEAQKQMGRKTSFMASRKNHLLAKLTDFEQINEMAFS